MIIVRYSKPALLLIFSGTILILLALAASWLAVPPPTNISLAAAHDVGDELGYWAQTGDLQPCSIAEEMRLLQTPEPVTPEPTVEPTATPEDAPTPTQQPTQRPAPSEDRVGFPENYQDDYKLLFVFDRHDNRSVRVICGNDVAASVQPGEAFPYGSVLLMASYSTRKGADGNPVLDENEHYIRERLFGLFMQRKEEGFGEAYAEDRSGEWEYVAYRPDGSILIPPDRTNACAACHLKEAGESVDYVFRMDLFFDGDAALQPPATADDEVAIHLYAFRPQNLTVAPGTTVTWINYDEAEHTVTALAAENETPLFESDVLASVHIDQGASFSFTFEESGTYEYLSSIHPAMTGTITVTE